MDDIVQQISELECLLDDLRSLKTNIQIIRAELALEGRAIFLENEPSKELMTEIESMESVLEDHLRGVRLTKSPWSRTQILRLTESVAIIKTQVEYLRLSDKEKCLMALGLLNSQFFRKQ